jgi:hypothetical protein
MLPVALAAVVLRVPGATQRVAVLLAPVLVV